MHELTTNPTDEGTPPAPRGTDLLAQEREALADLARLIAERARREPALDAEFRAQTQAVEAEFEATYQAVITRFAYLKETSERKLQETRKSILSWSGPQREALDRDYRKTREHLLSTYRSERQAAKVEFQESRWAITAVHEGSWNGSKRRLQEISHTLADARKRVAVLRQDARSYLRTVRQGGITAAAAPEAPEDEGPDDPLRRLQDRLAVADWKLVDLKALRLPQFFRGERLLFLFAALWALSIYPAAYFFGWAKGLIGSGGVVALVGGLVTLWLYAAARGQVRRVAGPLFQALDEAEELMEVCRQGAEAEFRTTRVESKTRYRREMRQALARYKHRRTEAKDQTRREIRALVSNYQTRRAAIKEVRARRWREAVTEYRQTRTRIQEEYQADSAAAHERHTHDLAEARQRHEAAWGELTQSWSSGLDASLTRIQRVQHDSHALFPAWDDPEAWADWQPPASIPPALRFGQILIDCTTLPGGLSPDPRLSFAGATAFALPALAAFPDGCSALLRADDDGRRRAVLVLQNLMFRLLTLVPPGKVRFTIIDPVGLGENFATFMHLADYDEALVGGRIWTEMAHIEQRLADLTAHMENVIQKYLRNQYTTIEAYNAQAGEVAEPYRFLVVANFPANFSVEATRRLLSIIHAGPRCGVYTLVSADAAQPAPQGVDVSDLEKLPLRLSWQDDHFVWDDAELGPFPLDLDEPPDVTVGTKLLHQVGERARAARRVEVPFEFVAPDPSEWWTADSREGLTVPLGRAGATKRQHLRLGYGTAQHALVAGKTGSGKSTLLHALVVNLALRYSPDEVELYLIDFKKGVEFKTYAAHELPHARVIAVESEREFGLSVLQRLDAELRQRGERFRAAGAQDLKTYRQSNGRAPLPRILLVVDEFQEFFVEEDRVAQEASLLLDRLVRQGRAFGLHVLLGSQTLGGAYSLARSTIDQMAVRVALQCGEADAHLILSEENAAARLLSRPGEAIYNDAGGRVEGNNPFQVVWLSDDRREDYLTRVRALAQARHPVNEGGLIVFEGNAPADPARNPELIRALEGPASGDRPRALTAWLGEAVAIKDPTGAVFRSQTGNNLLAVGQDDVSALGIFSTALVSLAAQLPPAAAETEAAARFLILDGTPDDSPHVGVYERVAAVLPQGTQVAGWRGVGATVALVAAEVDRRLKDPDGRPAPWFFIVHGLQRFRDLRRDEDDYAFGASASDRPNTARQFTTILRDGPTVGVHVLAWCDSYTNVTRALDRATLREFDLRVLFQMGSADSSNLIDSPAAARLGVHRALFHSEEQGRLEKFRPYAPPTEPWLERVKERLADRVPKV